MLVAGRHESGVLPGGREGLGEEMEGMVKKASLRYNTVKKKSGEW